MKAQDLRIGNLVSVGNETCSVTGIDMVCEECIVFIDSTPWNIKKLSPIPITEEWLRRFGFVRSGDDIIWYTLRYQNIELDTDSSVGFETVYLVSPNGSNMCVISYIHELQNLYFALTHTELILSPSTEQKV